MRRILATAVSALAFAGTGYSQELKAKWPGADSAELAKIAERLGDRDYRTREESAKLLRDAGADALPALRAVAATGNPEAADRAAGLIAKIESRIANAKVTAGTPVELKGEQTLGAAFDTLKKQTGYTIQLNGDQSPRSKKVTPKAGKLVFWESLQNLLDQAELEVEASAAIPTPVNFDRKQLMSGDEVYDGAAPLPPSGTVVVRQKQSKLANPIRISGAFRIEAIPVPVANLPQMPANRVPVLLQITPEPRFRWVGTTETLVTMAKNQDGHTLSWDFVSLDLQPMNFSYSGRRGGLRKGGGYYGGPIATAEFPVNQFQAYVKLAANPAGPSSVLREFEGLVRGRIWSAPETMLAISILDGTFAEVSGPNRTSLKAKVESMPGDATALLMTIVTTYNSGEVAPTNGATALNANPGVWIENGPGGRVKLNAVKLSPEELRMAQGFTNAYGLALVDGHGKPMNLSPHTTTQQNFYDGATNSSTFAITAQYVVRPATKDDAGKPAKLTFSGSRVKTIEVPFAFKDVPVLLGTGTNVQSRVNIDSYDW